MEMLEVLAWWLHFALSRLQDWAMVFKKARPGMLTRCFFKATLLLARLSPASMVRDGKSHSPVSCRRQLCAQIVHRSAAGQKACYA